MAEQRNKRAEEQSGETESQQGKITAKSVIRYMVFPGIGPRIKEFKSTGFSWLATLVASIYASVGLLPAGHPYLNPSNTGKFGVRHVIAAAASELKFKKENLDQIVIFFTVLIGFILLILQFVFLIVGLVIDPAFAQDTDPPGNDFTSLFSTPGCENPGAQCEDIAFSMLDLVFGIPGFFNSVNAPAGPVGSEVIPGFSQGFHLMLRFYSTGLLFAAILIFLYYVVRIVGETALTGSPFGKRFDSIWGPFRIIMAIGLLIPINHGLNTAQYIVLASAKAGSGFATNAVNIYFNSLEFYSINNLAGTNSTNPDTHPMIAKPTTPQVTGLLHFITIARSCREAYEALHGGAITIRPYLISPGARDDPNDPGTPADPTTTPPTPAVPPRQVVNLEVTAPGNPTFTQALEFYNHQNIIIRFGHNGIVGEPGGGDDLYPMEQGGVSPFCGEISFETKDRTLRGSERIQQHYYNLIAEMWDRDVYRDFALRVNCMRLPSGPRGRLPDCNFSMNRNIPGGAADIDQGQNQLPMEAFKSEMADFEQENMAQRIDEAYQEMIDDEDFGIPDNIEGKGWAALGMVYNQIAEMNGSLYSAVMNLPSVSLMPSVMRKIEEHNRLQNANVTAEDRYNTALRGGFRIPFDRHEEEIAEVLNEVWKYWYKSLSHAHQDVKPTGNIFTDILGLLFGVDGFFDMRGNNDVHPMAKLVAMGKTIIERSIVTMMLTMGSSAVAGFAEQTYDKQLAATAKSFSSMFLSLTTMGLSIGFILYYVLPFLPFMYFFFALGGWVKTIFEAMVGAPIWALAHLRLDGNGLPGEAAQSGYFLILEIFLRPFLVVVGLLAGIAIFSSAVAVLNDIFDIVVENAAGFDCEARGCLTATIGDAASIDALRYKRDIVTEFFYTLIYIIVVYLIGTSSFQLVDKIPQNILRWAGSGAQSFLDTRDDPTANLVQYAAIGGAQISSDVAKGLSQGANALGQGAGYVYAKARGLKSPEQLAQEEQQKKLSDARQSGIAEGRRLAAAEARRYGSSSGGPSPI